MSVYAHAISTELPFYQRHPRLTGAALGIAGGILLTPVTTSVMSYMGLGAGGAAVGNLTFPFAKET